MIRDSWQYDYQIISCWSKFPVYIAFARLFQYVYLAAKQGNFPLGT